MHPYFAGPRPRAYAHRGWHTGDLDGCENTLAAFTRAAAEGFGYLELDVHASADGVAVVHHDVALDRTTDGTGRLTAHTAAELAKVRVRGREPIPLPRRGAGGAAGDPDHDRAEVRRRRRADPRRGGRGAGLGPGVHRRLRAGVGRRGPARRRRAAVHVDGQARHPGPPHAGLAARRPPVAARGGDVAHVPVSAGPIRVVDAGLLGMAHANGREVHVWTIDAPEQMRRAARPRRRRAAVGPTRTCCARCCGSAASGRVSSRGRVFAWGLWDWGSSAYNAVILTFVFSVYLTDAVGAACPARSTPDAWLGYAIGAAGFSSRCWPR